MKLPAIQFYPGDWHKDQGVQALDLEHRGAWFEMLLMMHDSDERGVLLINGLPMPEDVIARRLGLVNQKFNQILTTLLNFGVASRRESDGAIFCRRMVRDENLRQIRTEAGKKGGNPNLVNQNSKQKPTTGVKQNSTPSITSSITTSKENIKDADAPKSLSFLEMLDACQKIYPGTKRGTKTEYADFEKKFKKEFTTEFFRALYIGIERKIKTNKTLAAAGGFVPEWPHLKTFLNQRRWEEETPEKAPPEPVKEPNAFNSLQEHFEYWGGTSTPAPKPEAA